MSIKLADSVEKDLLKLREIIQKKDSAWVNNNQEAIFTVLYLLLSADFSNKIARLREKHSIPKEWHTKEKLTDEDWERWEKWTLETKPTPPRSSYDEDIVTLCREVGINPMEYGEFIVGYLYFGQIMFTWPMGFNIQTADEYRYRAKLEADYGNGLYDISTNTPQKGYIRFYKDTTQNQLISFIKNNWKDIQSIQQDLLPYPHPKKYSVFKRDILIYLHHLFGNKAPTIANEVASISDNEGYAVDDVEVRQIISFLDRKLKKRLTNSKV